MRYSIEDIECTLLEKVEDKTIFDLQVKCESNTYVITYKYKYHYRFLDKDNSNTYLIIPHAVISDVLRRSDVKLYDIKSWEIADMSYDVKILVFQHIFVDS
jgi:hypothetical protein